ncbi:response regulator transcription factor [Georgenia ruanii]|uniref:Response regulator n=1 Tax=Georgenia ruanii TaxID=348442 RepID=A0A7J9UZD2_9MICO|nr:response regulator transcription factor [Georgenia ruanii]MPV89240.1 response regulator [Georgenia ruanii]
MSGFVEHRTAVVVEDDDDIRGLLVAVLTQAGFVVHPAATGHAGVELVRSHEPLVTTLDISLPDIDGFEVARRIRAFSATYLVMLTAHTDEVDTLLGLESGADDYVTKPFRPRELRARVEAMLRRPRHLGTTRAAVAPARPSLALAAPSLALPAPSLALPAPGAVAAAPSPAATAPSVSPGPITARAPSPGPVAAVASGLGPITAVPPLVATAAASRTATLAAPAGLRLDVDARQVFVDGAEVHLTPTEFTLLAALLTAPGVVRAKTELVESLWGTSYAAPLAGADRRSLEVHMANLRRKLGDDAARPRFIETVRGVGYRLVPAR